jgi:hypothetical protein
VPFYTVVDLTGDGKADLVVESDCADSTVGATKWLVFPNTGSGFAQTAMSFSLPPGYSSNTRTGAFGGPEGPLCSGTDVPFYTVVDLTGDGKADLVVESDCADSTVGATKWLVFPNGCGP